MAQAWTDHTSREFAEMGSMTKQSAKLAVFVLLEAVCQTLHMFDTLGWFLMCPTIVS